MFDCTRILLKMTFLNSRTSSSTSFFQLCSPFSGASTDALDEDEDSDNDDSASDGSQIADVPNEQGDVDEEYYWWWDPAERGFQMGETLSNIFVQEYFCIKANNQITDTFLSEFFLLGLRPGIGPLKSGGWVIQMFQ